jgi:integration host factor subunit alpha
MNLCKADIVKNISKKSLVSTGDATRILELLLLTIKYQSKSRLVKLSGFGSFIFKKTPERNGRNPKTKESYIIPKINKLNFKPSNLIKEKIN